jgi:hypothetical protein
MEEKHEFANRRGTYFVRDEGPAQRVLEIADGVGVHGIFCCVRKGTYVILLSPRLVNLLAPYPVLETTGK